jgi:ascorbate-specific PTS system EIIC-type component UlaA
MFVRRIVQSFNGKSQAYVPCARLSLAVLPADAGTFGFAINSCPGILFGFFYFSA